MTSSAEGYGVMMVALVLEINKSIFKRSLELWHIVSHILSPFTQFPHGIISAPNNVTYVGGARSAMPAFISVLCDDLHLYRVAESDVLDAE
jgi:hypothetical protein